MRIKGKIEKAEKCPIGKTNPCIGCEHYKGFDLEPFLRQIHIWCEPRKSIDAGKMKMVIPT